MNGVYNLQPWNAVYCQLQLKLFTNAKSPSSLKFLRCRFIPDILDSTDKWIGPTASCQFAVKETNTNRVTVYMSLIKRIAFKFFNYPTPGTTNFTTLLQTIHTLNLMSKHQIVPKTTTITLLFIVATYNIYFIYLTNLRLQAFFIQHKSRHWPFLKFLLLRFSIVHI